MLYCVRSEHGVHSVQMSPLKGGIENEQIENEQKVCGYFRSKYY